MLLILCANLANLVLARDAARDQEIAVRLALGAGRVRLFRQWLTEAILLSLLGALAGVLVAVWVKTALVAFIPADYRMNLDAPLGWRFMGFTLLVSLIVGLAMGLAPALRAARSHFDAGAPWRITHVRFRRWAAESAQWSDSRPGGLSPFRY